MRSILRPRRRKGAKHCSYSPSQGRSGDGKGCSRGPSPVRNHDCSCSPRSISPESQKHVGVRNPVLIPGTSSISTISPPRGRKGAKQCSHSPPRGRGGDGKGGVSRGASRGGNLDSSSSPRFFSPESNQHVGLLLLSPALFPAMSSSPAISPPPQGSEGAMHCSHSLPDGRGGDGKSGVSPVRIVERCDAVDPSPVRNFDSSFAPSSISPEIKGKTELVVCFGELLIDFVPTVGGLSLADAPAFKKAPGGAPANVAVGIAKLGGNAAFVGKVGDDEFGYMLVEVLKENRVETKGCRFDPKARTALAFVTLRADGEREFMFYRNPSADMLFETKELDTDILKAASIMHYGSISLITEPSRTTHMEAMRVAREGGCLLSYDPNLRLPLWPSPKAAKDGIKSIWDQADIIKVSDEEVVFLTGGDPKSDDNNMRMFHPRCKLMLVTEGGEGCRYYTQRFRGKVGGIKVQVVDTTGAGDAFCAGLLSNLAKDFGIIDDEARLREALKFANACGAITTTERGAIPSMPDRDTVLRMLRRPSATQSSTTDPSWQGYQKWRYRHSSIIE